jgi:hypothetical protein
MDGIPSPGGSPSRHTTRPRYPSVIAAATRLGSSSTNPHCAGARPSAVLHSGTCADRVAAAERRGDRVDLEELADPEPGVKIRQVGPGVGDHRHPHAAPTWSAQRACDVREGLLDQGGLYRPAKVGQQPGSWLDAEVAEDHPVVVVVIGCRGRGGQEPVPGGDARRELILRDPGRAGLLELGVAPSSDRNPLIGGDDSVTMVAIGTVR